VFMDRTKVNIVDASAIIAHDLILSLTNAITTPQILDELKDNASRLKADTALLMKSLKVIEPDQRYISTVVNLAKREGDIDKLSMADISLLALALQLKNSGHEVLILTDDYTIMNVARKLDLSYRPIKTPGIKATLKWIKYCPHCGVTYKSELSNCPVCGASLKVKGIRRKALSRSKKS